MNATKETLSVRLVVLCQRRPWIVCLLAAAAVLAVARPIRHFVREITVSLLHWDSPLPPTYAWQWRLSVGIDVTEWGTGLTVLQLVVALVAFAADVGRGGPRGWDRLVPWFVGTVGALVGALTLGGWARSGHLPWDEALVVTAPIALWPLCVQALVPGDPQRLNSRTLAIGTAATLVALPAAMACVVPIAYFREHMTAICLVLVPVAFQAVVRSTIRTRTVLVAAVVLGCAQFLLDHGLLEGRDAYGLIYAATWLASGLLAVAARRARSMTAVPLDHPIVEDFGGR